MANIKGIVSKNTLNGCFIYNPRVTRRWVSWNFEINRLVFFKTDNIIRFSRSESWWTIQNRSYLRRWKTCKTFSWGACLILCSLVSLFLFLRICCFYVICWVCLIGAFLICCCGNLFLGANINSINYLDTIERLPVTLKFPTSCISQSKLSTSFIHSRVYLKYLSTRTTNSSVTDRFNKDTIVNKNAVYRCVVDNPTVTSSWVWCEFKVDSLVLC